MTELAPQDIALLNRIGEVYDEIDPTPPEVYAAARAAFAWRDAEAIIAALVEDSSLQPLAGIRSAAAPRLLTFEADALAVEVEVAVDAERRRLVGQLVPPSAATLEVRHSDGVTTVTADDLGRFTVEVPGGPVSIACRLPGGAVVATSWQVV